jgi:hypothetical protein
VKKRTGLQRAPRADLLPVYQPPPDRRATEEECRTKLGFHFRRAVVLTHGGRARHAYAASRPLCGFTDEPLGKWGAVGHEAIPVGSAEQIAVAKRVVNCAQCLAELHRLHPRLPALPSLDRSSGDR